MRKVVSTCVFVRGGHRGRRVPLQHGWVSVCTRGPLPRVLLLVCMVVCVLGARGRVRCWWRGELESVLYVTSGWLSHAERRSRLGCCGQPSPHCAHFQVSANGVVFALLVAPVGNTQFPITVRARHTDVPRGCPADARDGMLRNPTIVLPQLYSAEVHGPNRGLDLKLREDSATCVVLPCRWHDPGHKLVSHKAVAWPQ